MNRMENIDRLTRVEEVAAYLMDGRGQFGGTMPRHTAKDVEDAAYQELEAELEGMERGKVLAVLEAAVNYSATVENSAFAYGMKAGALLLQSLFSREELLF